MVELLVKVSFKVGFNWKEKENLNYEEEVIPTGEDWMKIFQREREREGQKLPVFVWQQIKQRLWVWQACGKLQEEEYEFDAKSSENY